MFMGGAIFKQVILEACSREEGTVVMLMDPEWEGFRKAQIQWFPKTPPAQFWPTQIRESSTHNRMRKFV
jgi:hypothetical protein